MKIDLNAYILTDGKSGEIPVKLETKSVTINGAEYEITDAPEFNLMISNQASARLDIKADGVVTLSIPCDRCLEPVETKVDINIEEEIQIRDKALEDELPVFITDNELDADGAILDSLYSNFPAKILCREDCKGLCPKCGKNLNEGECGCDTFVPDPRLAGLQDMFKNFGKDNQ